MTLITGRCSVPDRWLCCLLCCLFIQISAEDAAADAKFDRDWRSVDDFIQAGRATALEADLQQTVKAASDKATPEFDAIRQKSNTAREAALKAAAAAVSTKIAGDMKSADAILASVGPAPASGDAAAVLKHAQAQVAALRAAIEQSKTSAKSIGPETANEILAVLKQFDTAVDSEHKLVAEKQLSATARDLISELYALETAHDQAVADTLASTYKGVKELVEGEVAMAVDEERQVSCAVWDATRFVSRHSLFCVLLCWVGLCCGVV